MVVITLLLSIVGVYLFYGVFAENLGQLIKNKRDSGVPISLQLKNIFQMMLNKKSWKE